MRTLIVYATKHGAAATCAESLSELLGDDVSRCQLGREQVPPLADFDQIIIGGSVHIGKIQKAVTKFMLDNQALLLQKKLGLFLCCMTEGENLPTLIKASFPEKLLNHATAAASFGGCFNFDQMNWLERKMIQMMLKKDAVEGEGEAAARVYENIDKINRTELGSFAAAMAASNQ